MGDQRGPRRRRLLDRRRASGGRAKIEPMLARTAFGENGSAQSGPSDDACRRAARARCGRSRRRCRGRRPRAGRRRAPRRASRPALRPDRDRPRARAERGDRGQQLRLDLLAAEPAAGGAQHEARLGAGGEPGLEQVLALGRRTGPRARGACARAACGPASASRFGGLSIIVVSLSCLFLSGFLLLERKSGPSSTARPGKWSVWLRLGGRTLPG